MAVVYKISDVYSLSNDFKEKLKVICSVEVGDKLCITDEKKLEKDNSLRITQPITRWWWQQNRYDIINFIEELIESYLSFLKFVYGAHKSPKSAAKEKKQLLNIYKTHRVFLVEVINGLTAIKETYNNTEDILRRLEKMIDDLQYLP